MSNNNDMHHFFFCVILFVNFFFMNECMFVHVDLINCRYIISCAMFRLIVLMFLCILALTGSFIWMHQNKTNFVCFCLRIIVFIMQWYLVIKFMVLVAIIGSTISNETGRKVVNFSFETVEP